MQANKSGTVIGPKTFFRFSGFLNIVNYFTRIVLFEKPENPLATH